MSGKEKESNFQLNWPKTTESIDVNKDALAHYKSYILNDKFDSAGKRIYNQEEIDALYEMISLLKSKNITPILIAIPHMREYIDILREKSPEFLNEFNTLINKICKDTGVKFYDYLCDERFINDKTLFTDTTHLNKFGARKFTNIVFEEIVNKEIMNKN